MILFLLVATIAGPSRAFAGSGAPGKSATLDSLVAQGNALYFQGEQRKAMERYRAAVAVSSMAVAPWLNGAVVLEELGEPLQAIRWFQRAAALPGAGDDALVALCWARLRAAFPAEARACFEKAVQRRPDDAHALLGLARAELVLSRPDEALKALDQAAQAAPLLNLIPYYQGKAYELLNRPEEEFKAYRKSVVADSYFLEGRDALGRAQLRARNFNEAWRHFSKILEVEPRQRRLRTAIQKLRPLLTRKKAELRAAETAAPSAGAPRRPAFAESALSQGRVPALRVGVGTSPMGKPLPREFFSFSVSTPFTIADAVSGKTLAEGPADKTWQVRLRRVKKNARLEVRDFDGKTRLIRGEAFLLRSASKSKGLIVLDPIASAGGSPGSAAADKPLRGDLEISIFQRKSIRLVNILDLENYTHGVVSAEMPIASPLEALKAQAVVARSHALFIKQVTRRHRREGYDLCDGQHCQVYAGVRAENQRSRDVVEATRGRIATYQGKVAHVIYSSNCGGHTQSGREAGWGEVPYWTGERDGADQPLSPGAAALPAKVPAKAPRSPWELRRWLYGTPPSYCKPSTYVHASHYRWTRVLTLKDLQEKIDRKYRLGRLLRIETGRRSVSGNVNGLVLVGSKRRVKLASELAIRGLLGLGSLRSTLFIFETEYARAKTRGDLVPETLVFHGGGWGHGVGLCQSGAMGRAEAGQTYEEIIKSYFKGTQVGQLRY